MLLAVGETVTDPEVPLAVKPTPVHPVALAEDQASAADWPEVIEGAHLREQFQMLRGKNILSEEELKKCNDTAFEATFVPKGGLSAYL